VGSEMCIRDRTQPRFNLQNPPRIRGGVINPELRSGRGVVLMEVLRQ